jgi:hypothetical protein
VGDSVTGRFLEERRSGGLPHLPRGVPALPRLLRAVVVWRVKPGLEVDYGSDRGRDGDAEVAGTKAVAWEDGCDAAVSPESCGNGNGDVGSSCGESEGTDAG